ncbi:hypothetical protein SLS60_010021 [Paraconiothyrium brasiliense]|uniref:Cytochrome P450 n=1 Tax=Paraconiothyrium brasiliense TaxID=300254 RepID=A0ABR3QT44_9PLEO
MFVAFIASFGEAVRATLVVSIFYAVGLLVYRLKFAPLAGFPGPKLAAITGWYEFYYDWWLGGKYLFHIEKLHQEYGPIIRVNPIEVSISDPTFYNEVYVAEYKRRTEHYDAFAQGLNFDGSFLLTKDHDLHRHRRKPFEPSFSKKGISSFYSILVEVSLKLEARLLRLKGTGNVVRLDHVFACYAGDIMGRLCFDDVAIDGNGEFLDDEKFAPDWYNVLHMMVLQVPLFTAFPWLAQIIKLVPKRLLLWAFPQGHAFNTFTEVARQRVRAIINLGDSNVESKPASVFHALANSNMPDSEKTEDRLTIEAQILLAAGTVTSARTIVMAAYYLLTDTRLQSELRSELRKPMNGWPDRAPTMAELENLPLLQAISKEALRLVNDDMQF